MNQTPLTDQNVALVAESGLEEGNDYVRAIFAEELEIENNQLRDILAEMTARYEKLEKLYFAANGITDSPDTNGTIQRARKLLGKL